MSMTEFDTLTVTKTKDLFGDNETFLYKGSDLQAQCPIKEFEYYSSGHCRVFYQTFFHFTRKQNGLNSMLQIDCYNKSFHEYLKMEISKNRKATTESDMYSSKANPKISSYCSVI